MREENDWKFDRGSALMLKMKRYSLSELPNELIFKDEKFTLTCRDNSDSVQRIYTTGHKHFKTLEITRDHDKKTQDMQYYDFNGNDLEMD